MTDPKPSSEEVANATSMRDDSARRPFNPTGGADESSTSSNGDESGLHDDQKPITGSTDQGNTDGDNDRHKTEELTKAGRDIDPDNGSE